MQINDGGAAQPTHRRRQNLGRHRFSDAADLSAWVSRNTGTDTLTQSEQTRYTPMGVGTANAANAVQQEVGPGDQSGYMSYAEVNQGIDQGVLPASPSGAPRNLTVPTTPFTDNVYRTVVASYPTLAAMVLEEGLTPAQVAQVTNQALATEAANKILQSDSQYRAQQILTTMGPEMQALTFDTLNAMLEQARKDNLESEDGLLMSAAKGLWRYSGSELLFNGLVASNELAQHSFRTMFYNADNEFTASDAAGMVLPQLRAVFNPQQLVDNWNATAEGEYNETLLDEARLKYGTDRVDMVVALQQAHMEGGSDAVMAKFAEYTSAEDPERAMMAREVMNGVLNGLYEDPETQEMFDQIAVAYNGMTGNIPRQYMPSWMRTNAFGEFVGGTTNIVIPLVVDPTIVGAKAIGAYRAARFAVHSMSGGYAVDQAFRIPSVRRFWDEFGKRWDEVESLRRVGASEAGVRALTAERQFSKYLTPEFQAELRRAGVRNAEDAQVYFQEGRVTELIASGRGADNLTPYEALLRGQTARRGRQLMMPHINPVALKIQRISARALRANPTNAFGRVAVQAAYGASRIDQDALTAKLSTPEGQASVAARESLDGSRTILGKVMDALHIRGVETNPLENAPNASYLADVTVPSARRMGWGYGKEAGGLLHPQLRISKALDRWSRAFARMPNAGAIYISDARDANKVFRYMRAAGISRYHSALMADLWRGATEGQRRVMLSGMMKTAMYAKGLHLVDPVRGPRIIEDMMTATRTGERYSPTLTVYDDPLDAAAAYEATYNQQLLPRVDPAAEPLKYQGDVAEVVKDANVIFGGTGRRISAAVDTQTNAPRLIESAQREIRKLEEKNARASQVFASARPGQADFAKMGKQVAARTKRINQLHREIADLRRNASLAGRDITEARRVRRETGLVNPLTVVERTQAEIDREYAAITKIRESLTEAEARVSARQAEAGALQVEVDRISSAASLADDMTPVPVEPGVPDPRFIVYATGQRPTWEEQVAYAEEALRSEGVIDDIATQNWTDQLPDMVRPHLSQVDRQMWEEHGLLPLELFERQLARAEARRNSEGVAALDDMPAGPRDEPFGPVYEDELAAWWHTGSFEKVEEVYDQIGSTQGLLSELQSIAQKRPGHKARPPRPKVLYDRQPDGSLVKLTGQARVDAIQSGRQLYDSRGMPTKVVERTGRKPANKGSYKKYVRVPWARSTVERADSIHERARHYYDQALDAYDSYLSEVTARAEVWAGYSGRVRWEMDAEGFRFGVMDGDGPAMTWHGPEPPRVVSMDSPLAEAYVHNMEDGLAAYMTHSGVDPEDARAVAGELLRDMSRPVGEVADDYAAAYASITTADVIAGLDPEDAAIVWDMAREQALWSFEKSLSGRADMVVNGQRVILNGDQWGVAMAVPPDPAMVAARESAVAEATARLNRANDRMVFWQTRREQKLAALEQRMSAIDRLEQRMAQIKSTPRYQAMVKAQADGRISQELLDSVQGHVVDPARWGDRQHALHLPQTSSWISIPSFSQIDRVAARHSVAGVLLGRNRAVEHFTNWWVLATLAGPRYALRNAFEDITLYALTGGKWGDLLHGRTAAQVVRETRGLKSKRLNAEGRPVGRARRDPAGKLGPGKEVSRRIGDRVAGSRILEAIFKPHIPQERLASAIAKREAGNPDEYVALVADVYMSQRLAFLNPEFRAGVKAGYIEDFARFHQYDLLDEAAEADRYLASGMLPGEMGSAGDMMMTEFPNAVTRVKSVGPWKDMRVNIDSNPSALRHWQKEVAWIADHDGPIGQRLIQGLWREESAQATIDDIARILADDTSWGYKERFSAFSEAGASPMDFATRYYYASKSVFQRSDRTVNKTLIEKLLHKTDDSHPGEWDRISAYDPETGYMVWSQDELAQIDTFDRPWRVLGRDSGYVVADNDMSLVDRAWGMMGRQMARIAREPVFMANYFDVRKSMKATEAMWAAQFGDDAARRMASSAAYERAFAVTMSYTDNPGTRSVLSWQVRNVARFYRATEDFYRRIMRTATNNPTALWKAGLTYDTLQSSGWVWQDDEGESYFVYPGSQVAIQAAGAVLGWFGKESYMPGLPMQFTGKLSMLSPSMDKDGYIPSLSGVWGAVTMKTLFQMFPTAAAWERDLLGKYAVGQSWTDVVFPPSVNRALATMSQGDRETVWATSWREAAALVAAQGVTAGTPAETEALRSRLDMTATGLVGLKLLLGFGLPASPQFFDTSASDAAMSLGITSLRPAFTKLVQQYGGDTSRAAAEWFQMNPDLMPFTVSTYERAPNAGVYQPLSGVRVWHEEHLDLVERHPVGATYFAPMDGEFNWAVWSWLKRSGAKVSKPLDDFLLEVMSAEGAHIYDQLSDAGDRDRLAGTPLSEVQANLKRARADLYLDYPGLEAYIGRRIGQDRGTKLAELDDVRGAQRELEEGGDTSDRVRLMGIALRVYDRARLELDQNAGSSTVAEDARRQIRSDVAAMARDLGGQDVQVRNVFSRYILPLLDIKLED